MPIVNGIEAFRDAMANHDGEYVLIGGGACSILFDAAGDSFRMTKDLDIIVLTDVRGGSGFASDFWAFIKQNGYESWKQADGACAYYRFNLPQDSSRLLQVPEQIELFARHPDFALEDEDSVIAPLHFDEGVSSLSAIILDDGYYEFIRSHVTIVGGVPLLMPLHIIPLKMRAHIDLNQKHKDGCHVNEKDLTKHRKDVADLSRLLAPDDVLPLQGQMREDAELFLVDFEQYVRRETSRKRRHQLEEDLQTLRQTYLRRTQR